MNENKTNICPCCPKGCDLSNPRCGRGEEYLRTGVIPEKGNRNHHHEEHPHSNYEEMSIDEKLFALLNRLGRAGHGGFNGKSSQNRILHILSKSGRMTQRELTQQLGIQPGSASEIIKKLETAGLVTRQSNSEDRRTVDIALTDAGKAQAEGSNAQYADHALFDVLSDEEKQQLLALLEKLGHQWHGHSRGEHKHHAGKGCCHTQGHGCKLHNEQDGHHCEKHNHNPEQRHGHKHGRGHIHESN